MLVISENRKNSKKLGKDLNENGVPVCPKNINLLSKMMVIVIPEK
ncbi:hypothetical protein [Natranaerobius trueperi]|nr:hypothetical protein [Natranaerobius trueperi]